MTSLALKDIVVATVVPFRHDGNIDWAGYDRALEFCTRPASVRAVFVNGHAGEGATLTAEERVEVIRRTRRFLGDDVPLLTGLIGFSTTEMVVQAKEAEANGADVAVMFPLPQFQGGASSDPRYVVDLVDTLLAETSLPLSIFQQAVSSGNGFTTPVLKELVKRERVIAVKEGSGDIGLYEDNLRELKQINPNVSILASNYHWLFAQVATGGDGILSGMASLVPHMLSDLWEASQANDLVAMRRINDRLYPVVRSIYGAPPLIDMHTRIKVGLAHLGVIDNANPRKPLLAVSRERTQSITNVVDAMGLKESEFR